MSSTGLQLGHKLKGIERPPLAITSNGRSGSTSLSTSLSTNTAAADAASGNATYLMKPSARNEASIKSFLRSADKRQRKHFYQQLLAEISKNQASPELLLNFVRFEPNLKLVQMATRDYLTQKHCAALDEFDGVKQIVELFEQNQLSNTGAVFAGLLSMNDRRINAVIRTLRTRLSLADIREFSRIHPAELHAASIEFYMDWSLELQQKKESQRFNLVCSALKLMVLHDEYGSVFDYSEHANIGFKTKNPTFATRFEDYLPRILPMLNAMGKMATCRDIAESMLKTWEGHSAIAPALRSVSQHQPYDCSIRQQINAN